MKQRRSPRRHSSAVWPPSPVITQWRVPPCEGRFTDRFGQVHYLLLEPEAGKEFRRGDKVIIVCRLSGSRWLGELNPWPDVL